MATLAAYIKNLRKELKPRHTSEEYAEINISASPETISEMGMITEENNIK